MIVEFAGAPSAGKTTLAAAVLPLLDQSVTNARLSPGASFGKTAGNVLRTPRSLSEALVHPDSRSVLVTSWRSSRGRASLLWRLARCASAARRVADHRAMSVRRDLIHIVDEGVSGLLSLAITGGNAPYLDVVEKMTSQLPRSDITIVVCGDVKMITARNLARSDSPREWRRFGPDEVASRIRNVQDAYLRLFSNRSSTDVLIVTSPENNAQKSEAARRIAALIELKWLEHE